MRTRALAAATSVALLIAAGPLRAGSMSGATHELVPTAIESGGEHEHASTSHQMIGGVGELGQSSVTSTSHILQPGLPNLILWPQSITDLAAVPGAVEGQIVLSWTAPKADGSTGTATEYSVRVSSGGQADPNSSEAQFWLSLSATHYLAVSPPSAPGVAEQLTFTGLENGLTYRFAVKAGSEWGGWSYLGNAASVAAQTDSIAPNAVVLGAATGVGEGEIELYWTVSGDNAGVDDLVGGQYEITYSSHGDFSSGVYMVTNPTAVAQGSAVSYTLTGLAGGETYFMKLRLADEVPNWSDPSNTAIVAAQVESTPPGAPTLSAFPGAVEGELRLTWTVTGDDGGSGDIVGGQYEITYSSHSDFSSGVYMVTNPTSVVSGEAVDYTVSGLEAGTVYYAKLRLADEIPNWGAVSNTASAAAQTDVTPPGAVVGLVADGVAAGQVRVTWTVTGDDGVSGDIVGGQYEITYSSYSDFSSGVYQVTNGTSTTVGELVSVVVTGLEVGAQYFFKLRLADEAANFGAESNAADAIAQGDVTPPAAPALSAATGAGDGEVDLFWTVTGDDGASGNIDFGQYEITYSSHSDFSSGVYAVTNGTSVVPGEAVSYTLTGLEPGAAYYAKLRLADEVPNWSAVSNTANAAAQQDTAPPAAPTVGAFTGTVEGELRLTWTVTGDDGSSGDIVGGQYEITYSSHSDFSSGVYQVTGGTTASQGEAVEHLLTGLEGGTVFYARVRLADEAGNWSANSNTADAAAQNDVTAPVAPTLNADTGALEGQIELSWTVTGDDGTFGALAGGQYEITYSSHSDFSSGVYQVANATTVSQGEAVAFTLSGLEGGTVYFIRLSLADEIPNWSGDSNTAVAAAQGDVTAPAAPVLTAVTGTGGGQLDLSWTVTGDDGSSGDITGGQYEITYSSYSDFSQSVYAVANPTSAVQGESVSYTLAGLEGGTLYYAKLRLADEIPNWSPPSNTASASTLDGVSPDAIVDLDAQPGASQGEVRLTWSATGDDADLGAIAGGRYRIDYTDDPGFAFNVLSYKLDFATNVAPGDAQTLTVPGLLPDVMYYFKIFLGDEVPNWSAASNLAGSNPAGLLETPSSCDGCDIFARTPSQGGRSSLSASHFAFTDAGELGQSSATSTSHILQPGLPNLILWPGTITDLAAAPGAVEGEIVLSWTAPKADGSTGTASSYSVRMSSGGEADPASSESQFWLSLSATHYLTVSAPGAPGAAEQLVFTGLENGLTYRFAVKADSGWGGWSYLGAGASVAAQVDTIAPSAPVLTAETGAAEGEIELSWSVSGDNGVAGDLAGGQYEITYSSHADFSSGVYTVTNPTSVAQGQAVNFTLTGLEGGAGYFIKLRLADEVPNWSDPSNTALADAQVESNPPDAPTLSAFAGAVEGELRLAWIVTGDDGAAGDITDGFYEIAYSSHSDFSSGVYTVTNPTSVVAGEAVDHTLAGLEAGTVYYAKLRLSDEIPNWSALSNTANAAVQTDVTPPTAVAGLVADGIGAGQVRLRWTVTGDDAGTGDISAGQYEITYSSFSDFTDTAYVVANGTAVVSGESVSYILSGLEIGTEYFFKLRLADEAGNWSAESNTTSAIAQDDVTPPDAVTLSAVTGAGNGELELSWTVTGDDGAVGAIDFGRYEVTYSSYSDFSSGVYVVTNATSVAQGEAVSYTLSDLEAGTAYYVKLRLGDEVPNWSAVSNTDSATAQQDTTPPAAPTLSAFGGALEGELLLTWTVTGDDGSSGDLVGGQFEITYSSHSDFSSGVYVVSNPTSVAQGAAVGYLLTGLASGVPYYARLRLADETPNWSSNSNTANAAAQNDIIAPDAPTLNADAGPLEGQVILSWTVTGDNASLGSISGGQYEIAYSSHSDFSSGVYTVTNPTSVAQGESVSYLLGGLEGGTVYFIRLRLGDEVPNWSANSNTAAVAAQIDVTPPDAVTLAAATGAGGGELALSWTVTGDDGGVGDIVGGQFEVTYSTYSDFSQAVFTLPVATSVAQGEAVSYTLAGLEGGMTYFVRLRLADESLNWSADSNVDSATTIDSVPPDAIADLGAVEGDSIGEVRLTWSATGDDGNTGPIVGGRYRVDYTNDPDFNFDVSSFQLDFATNVAPGDAQALVVSGLLPDVFYYFKVFLADENLNWSAESNLAGTNPAGLLVAPSPCVGCDIFARTPSQGGRSSLSASHFVFGTVGERGSKEAASSAHILQPGLGNLIYWPETILDLSASSGTYAGEIDLYWSSPRADGSTGTAVEYNVRISSGDDPSPGLSESDFWLSLSATHYMTVPAPIAGGTSEHLVVTGLEAGVTYYFAIKAKSSSDGWSYLAGAATAYAQRDIAPAPISNLTVAHGFVGGAVELSWTATGENGARGDITGGAYRIDFTTEPDHAFAPNIYQLEFATNTTAGQAESYTLTDLLGGASYFVRVYLKDPAAHPSDLSNGATAQARVFTPDLNDEPDEIFTSSFTVSWSSGVIGFGYNSEQARYRAEAYTAPDYTGIPVSSDTVGLSATLSPLDPNTTYYTRVVAFATAEPVTNVSTPAAQIGSSTLAEPPATLAVDATFLTVGVTSAAVAWAAAPTAPQAASNEGYVLEASSTNFGALSPGGVVYATTTPSVLLSTLTLALLPAPAHLCEEYYFRVGALNWSGLANYTVLGSTRAGDYGVVVSTQDLDVGNIDIDTEIVISTSLRLSNAACPVTYQLMVATITPGSPWVVATSSGSDAFTVQALFSSAQPAPGDFADADKLTDVPMASTPGVFAGDQTGFDVPVETDRLVWFKFGMPRQTSTVDEQQIRVTVIAVPP